MATVNIVKQIGRLALAGAVIVGVTLVAEKPASAIDAGTAVGIGLGSAALGAAVGSAANPYNNPYYYPLAMPIRLRATTPPRPIIPRDAPAGIRTDATITPAKTATFKEAEPRWRRRGFSFA